MAAALTEVIDKAQRLKMTRDGTRFTAQQNGHGAIQWTVSDAQGRIVKQGRCT